MHYILLFGVVLLIDLIPAFGPPAWIVAVFFRYKYHLAFVLVVVIAALATAIGRTLLALITRRLRRYIPAKYVESLDYSKRLIAKNRRSTKVFLGLFLLSPLPSAQLFEAAGLMNVPLLPLGVAFFAGRLVSLSLYLEFAHLTVSNFNRILESGLDSVWAIVFELLSLIAILAMLNARQLSLRFHRRKNKHT